MDENENLQLDNNGLLFHMPMNNTIRYISTGAPIQAQTFNDPLEDLAEQNKILSSHIEDLVSRVSMLEQKLGLEKETNMPGRILDLG